MAPIKLRASPSVVTIEAEGPHRTFRLLADPLVKPADHLPRYRGGRLHYRLAPTDCQKGLALFTEGRGDRLRRGKDATEGEDPKLGIAHDRVGLLALEQGIET